MLIRFVYLGVVDNVFAFNFNLFFFNEWFLIFDVSVVLGYQALLLAVCLSSSTFCNGWTLRFGALFGLLFHEVLLLLRLPGGHLVYLFWFKLNCIFNNFFIKAESGLLGRYNITCNRRLRFLRHFELLSVDAQICDFFVFLRVSVGALEVLCLLVEYLLYGHGRLLLIEALEVALRLRFVLQTLRRDELISWIEHERTFFLELFFFELCVLGRCFLGCSSLGRDFERLALRVEHGFGLIWRLLLE